MHTRAASHQYRSRHCIGDDVRFDVRAARDKRFVLPEHRHVRRRRVTFGGPQHPDVRLEHSLQQPNEVPDLVQPPASEVGAASRGKRLQLQHAAVKAGKLQWCREARGDHCSTTSPVLRFAECRVERWGESRICQHGADGKRGSGGRRRVEFLELREVGRANE